MNTEQSEVGGKRKKRNLQILKASAIVAVLLIGGIIWYIASNSKHAFTAVANTNQPFVATLSSTLIDHTTTTTLQSDGHGNLANIVAIPGLSRTTVYTHDAYYECNNSLQACKKYPGPSPSDFVTYTYDAARIKDLKATTKYSGQKKCPDGKSRCDVWIATTQYNTTTEYYVNAATKQLVRYVHHGYIDGFKNKPKATIEAIYEYKNVHITVPTKYTDAPTSG